jgi:molybdenum cofactor cytidylyltransferase
MISGILLAAGESKRMEGAFKPLLKWGTRTVIEACVDNLRRSRLDEIIVVLGHREAEIRARLASAGVEFAINRDYQKGMLSSIKTGLTVISPRSDAILVALVDQPMVGPEVINPLISAYRDHDQKIALPTYQGKHGHPIIVSADYMDEMLNIADDSSEGLRTLIEAHRDEILEVPVDRPAVLEDIDRPEDYQRLSEQVAPLYEQHKWHP